MGKAAAVHVGWRDRAAQQAPHVRHVFRESSGHSLTLSFNQE
jgi:hypothetical protein